MTKPKCGIRVGEKELIGIRCVDGGKCHHLCDTECLRRDCCVPLTASGLNDDWSIPDDDAPASGEPEVIGYRIPADTPVKSGYTLTLNPVSEGRYQTPVADYCHVTRLQAEMREMDAENDHLLSANATLQSELTKARELLAHAANYMEGSASALVRVWVDQMRDFLSNQSAPADKE